MLTVVEGDSWAALSLPQLNALLGRSLRDHSQGGLTFAARIATPGMFPAYQVNDFVYLSLGGLDVIFSGFTDQEIVNVGLEPEDFRPEQVISNMVAGVSLILKVSGTRVAHIGYNDAIPDPPAQAIAALQSMYPSRYRFISNRELDLGPLVQLGSDDLHLRNPTPPDYSFVSAVALSKLAAIGWTP